MQVRELAPLTRADVRLAAEAAGIADPDAFVAALRAAAAVPLALKPLSLGLLLRIYRSRGALPARQADLFRRGCRLLCEESEGRRELRLPRSLEAGQRLAVAERIAALTVFANRAAVSPHPDRGERADEDLPLRAATGGTEVAGGDAFVVGEAGVEEALNTGLFSARGDGRLGWAHRTYEEFLAASYLVDHEVPLPQIVGLIVHPGDPQEGPIRTSS